MSQQPSESLPREVVSQNVGGALQGLAQAASQAGNAPAGEAGVVIPPIESVLAGARLGNAIFEAIKSIVIVLARGFIAPVEVLLRRQIGERYFTPLTLIGCVASLYLATMAINLSQTQINWLLALFAAGSTAHAWLCFARDRRGAYWHSYSEGESRLRVGAVDVWLAQRYFTFDFSKLVVEPVALLLLGLVLHLALKGRMFFWNTPFGYTRFESSPLALYCGAAAIVAIGYQLYCWSYRRQKLLDEKDALVIAEARQIARAPEANPGIRTHKGVSFRSAPAVAAWQR